MDTNQPTLMNKLQDMLVLMDKYLKHAPKHEKFALCLEIRKKSYEVLGLVVECNKRYHKKTALSSLDIAHEQLRVLWHTYWKMGYFCYSNGKKYQEKDPLRRYNAMSVYINEIGAMIGGWIRRECN